MDQWGHDVRIRGEGGGWAAAWNPGAVRVGGGLSVRKAILRRFHIVSARVVPGRDPVPASWTRDANRVRTECALTARNGLTSLPPQYTTENVLRGTHTDPGRALVGVPGSHTTVCEIPLE